MSKQIPLVLWGASGHARVVADIVRLRGEHEIAGFVDDRDPSRRGAPFCGARVLGLAELVELRRAGVLHLLVAVGDCAARLRLAERARRDGFTLAPAAVHPSAVVAEGVELGAGSVVAAGAIVNPGVRIGENVIVNTGASVDHECLLDDGVHVGPGARLGGCVTVGRAVWIGIGATVIDRIRIGADAQLGAGAVVVDDIPPGVLAYGVPARVVRKLAADE